MLSSLQEVLSMNYIIIQKEKEIFKLNIKDIYYIQTHPSKAHTVQIVTEEASFDLFQNLRTHRCQYLWCGLDRQRSNDQTFDTTLHQNT